MHYQHDFASRSSSTQSLDILMCTIPLYRELVYLTELKNWKNSAIRKLAAIVLFVLLYFIAEKMQVLWLKCVISKIEPFWGNLEHCVHTSCCLRDQGPPYSYLYFTALCIAISIEIPSMKWKKKDLLAPQWPYVCTMQYLCKERVVLLMAG